MSDLIKVNNETIVTLDSREVAEMLGKDHSMLLREIDGSKDGKTVGIIQTLENANFAVSNYFIRSTYKSGTREYKCYQVTKMGCELIGNKQQGEKGIIFTAKYVEKFNKMEQSLKEQKPTCIEDVLITSLQEMKMLKQQLNQINNNALRANKLAIEVQEEVKSMKEVVSLDTTSWRRDTQNLINKIAINQGGCGHINLLRKESYELLNKRFGVKLDTRLTNKRRRMAEEGVTKSKRDKLNYLDVIAEDKKLIEGYIAIVKDMAIKYGISNKVN